MDWGSLPASKASVVTAWTCFTVMSWYCFCVSYDLRGVYNQNHKIQRQLHIAHARADDAETRIAQLRAEHTKTGDAALEDLKNTPEVSLSHEMELTRERSRAATLLERNQLLVTELTEARAALAQTKQEKKAAEEELAKFRQIMKRLDVA